MRYPLTLTDTAGPAVVVGGGVVGERKVRGLLAGGVAVRLISPDATGQLRAWAQAGAIEWAQRPYRDGDLAGAGLAFAATDQRAVNRAVAEAARGLGLLVNVADAPAEGNFHAPAVTRQRGLIVAVSTDAGRPRRATRTRDRIAQFLTQIFDREEPEL